MLNEIDISRLDLNLLGLFEVVLEQRHVGRAAQKLSLTPSAVSHGLGRLRRMFEDPLFMRTPKGVVPTARALELSPLIADVLTRVRRVIATVAPFDPATSSRRFTIGGPDGAVGVFLPVLLTQLQEAAPGVDLAVLNVLRDSLELLETRELDVAILPVDEAPARFRMTKLYEDDFVIAARVGHPFLREPTLDHYCRLRHVLVSVRGDARGYVDELLEKQGRSRRIALTVPTFMLALAALSDTDLVAVIPLAMVQQHGARFGLTSTPAPLPFQHWTLQAIAPESALMDAGLTWFIDCLKRAAAPSGGPGPVRVRVTAPRTKRPREPPAKQRPRRRPPR